MLKRIHFVLFIILLVGISSCKVDKARPFKKQYLIIASDCLSIKDTILFRSFKTLNGIRIRILPMTADSLRKRLHSEKLNTEIDAVILASPYDMVHLEKSDFIQHLSEDKIPDNLPTKFISRSRKWIGLGCDPYVIVSVQDTLKKVKTYKNLAESTKWCTNLASNSEWYPFYSAIVNRINSTSKYNALDWIRNFNDNKLAVLQENDSTSACSILLTSYSKFRKSPTVLNSQFKKGKLIFPNQRTGGSYYSMPTFAVIKQARNFSNAVKFLDYLTIETVNKRLNFNWLIFPIISSKESSFSYQNTRFKKYSISPVRLTENYERINNILNTIDR